MRIQRSSVRAALLATAATVAMLPFAAQAEEPLKAVAPIIVAGTPSVESVAAAPAPADTLIGLDTLSLGKGSQARSQSPVTEASSAPSSNQWLVVLIQTALAEKGCNRVSINGEWTHETRISVANVLGSAQSTTEFEPTSATLTALRTAAVDRCGIADRNDAKPPLTGAGRKAASREKKGRVAVAAVESSAKAKTSGTRGSAKSARQVGSAGAVVARAPAAFVRPVGVGAF